MPLGVRSNADSLTNGPAQEWRPSIVLGSSLWLEGEDLNAIEIADRKVVQTRLWADHYRGVPYFVQTHQEAVEERDQLDETAEENTTPRSVLKSTHDHAIQDRLEILGSLLQDSSFPDERENIEAAMAGYQSGAITFSDSYTLLWAGHIVDRCPDFDSFTNDRSARLDRYAAEHGPGWLWYEPPLSAGSGTMRGPTVVAKKGFCLESKALWRQGTENMGHYNIRMGFRRRKANVTRGNGRGGCITGGGAGGATNPSQSPFATPTTTATHNSSRVTTSPTTQQTQPHLLLHHHHHPQTIPQPDTSAPGKTVPDPDGPRVLYNMLLDSGATLPTLWAADLAALGVHPARYAAQSARRVNTADSTLISRVYELDVRVFGSGADPAGVGTESETNTTTTTTATPSLGCTIPVLVFPGASKADPATTSGAPDSVPDRLSGLLPFHVCYVSGAPGTFRLWMGEDRRDVLGAGRLPGMMRYGEILGGVTTTTRRSERSPLPLPLPLPLPPPPSRAFVDWRSQGLKTPERVIFEHELVGVEGAEEEGLLRDEDRADGNVLMRGPRGANFDKADAKAEGIQVLHIERKRKLPFGGQSPRRRGSALNNRPVRKKVKNEHTGQKASG